jgi:hypothetical protein
MKDGTEATGPYYSTVMFFKLLTQLVINYIIRAPALLMKQQSRSRPGLALDRQYLVLTITGTEISRCPSDFEYASSAPGMQDFATSSINVAQRYSAQWLVMVLIE